MKQKRFSPNALSFIGSICLAFLSAELVFRDYHVGFKNFIHAEGEIFLSIIPDGNISKMRD
jgi:hypothetical protein